MSGNGSPVVVLIPARNEVATIACLVDAVLRQGLAVQVIDDGSTDGTSEALTGKDIRLTRFETSAGKGRRLADGLAAAFGEGAGGVLTMDGDGQHDPAEIPAFLAAHAEDRDALVMGNRFSDPAAMPKGRARSIRFGDAFISWACARRLSDCQCGMRLYPRAYAGVSVPDRLKHGFVYETAALLYAAETGLAFRQVPIAARYAGFTKRRSHFRPVGDFARITLAVTRFLLSRGLRPRGLLIALGWLR